MSALIHSLEYKMLKISDHQYNTRFPMKMFSFIVFHMNKL